MFTCVKLPKIDTPPYISDFNDCIVVIGSKVHSSNNVLNLWRLDDEACLREALLTLILSIGVVLPVKCVCS